MKRGQGTRDKVINARAKGAKTGEIAKSVGISRRMTEKILAKPEVKAEIAQRFANAQEARAYCHRRVYERIGDMLDNDDKWERGMEKFQQQSESDAKVMASVQPQQAPGVAVQINQTGVHSFDTWLKTVNEDSQQ